MPDEFFRLELQRVITLLWWLATILGFWTGPYVFGASWAVLLGASFSLSRILLGYLVLLPAHLSVSYSNDYFDVGCRQVRRTHFRQRRQWCSCGSPRIEKTCLLDCDSLNLLLSGTRVVFSIVYSFSIWFMCFVVMGNLLGWFLHRAPLRLAYRGLGELSMIFTIGMLIPGLGYLVTNGQINQDGLLFFRTPDAVWFSFHSRGRDTRYGTGPIGNKRTWVARKGRSFGFTAVTISFLLATLFFLCIPRLTTGSYPWIFISWPSCPHASRVGCFGMQKKRIEKRSATRVVYGINDRSCNFLYHG